VDDRNNALVVKGPTEDVIDIAKLLQDLDKPGSVRQVSPSVAVFSLANIEATRELEDALRMLFPPKGSGKFVVDRERRTVLVYADNETINQVKALLSRIDVPAPLAELLDVRVRVFLFVNAPRDEEAPKLAKEFQQVEAELKTLGFDRPTLLSQVMVQTVPGSTFEAAGQLPGDTRRQLRVTGQLVEPGVKTRLNLQISLGSADGQTPPGSALRSNVLVAPGRMMVVGVAPIKTTQSAFVVEVTARIGGTAPGKKAAFTIPQRPWSEMLEWLSSQTGLPVIANVKPTGTCRINAELDHQPTTAELIDLLNGALMQQHFLLMRGEQSIVLVPADEPIEPSLVPRVGLNELSKRGRTELVSVVMPLDNVKALDVAASIKKLLGSFGTVTVEPVTNQLVLQDIAGNLRLVVAVLGRHVLKKPAN
jgi:hypothetical protein